MKECGLADPRAASTMQRVDRIPGEGIPGHRPVRFDLAVEAASQEELRAVRPPQLILPERDSQRALGEALLSLYQGRLETLLAARRLDELWAFWTWAAEESLLALSQEALTDPGAGAHGGWRHGPQAFGEEDPCHLGGQHGDLPQVVRRTRRPAASSTPPPAACPTPGPATPATPCAVPSLPGGSLLQFAVAAGAAALRALPEPACIRGPPPQSGGTDAPGSRRSRTPSRRFA